jgi:hypothetical protein
MVRKYLLIAAGCLLAVPGLMVADDLDPFVDVVGGDPTQVIDLGGITTGLVNVQPDNNAGTTEYQLFNDTGEIVTGLKIDTTIATGLNVTMVENLFFTTSQLGAGYFEHHTVTYNPTSGDLLFNFFGVEPPDGDELCPQEDCEINEQEGIPPGGIFTIRLGGWTDNAMFGRTQLYTGRPTFTDTDTLTPEPAMFVVTGIGLLLAVGVVQFRRRKALSQS